MRLRMRERRWTRSEGVERLVLKVGMSPVVC